jgi:predicted secreted protein
MVSLRNDMFVELLQAHISEESKPGVTPQLTKKMIVDFQPKVEGRIRITY